MELAGFEAKVQINGTNFAVTRWSVRPSVADLDTSDSESGEYEDRISGMKVSEIMLENASFDPDNNPFAAPFSCEPGEIVHIEIFPEGLGSDSHDFPTVLVINAEHRGEAKALQPQTITAKTKGPYTLST